MSDNQSMHQTAPWPAELEDLVKRWKHRGNPEWRFWLESDTIRDPKDTHGAEGRGLTFCVQVIAPNSRHPEQTINVRHMFIVPAATYNRAAWRRWVQDRVEDVVLHETREFSAQAADCTCTTYSSPGSPYHMPNCDSLNVFEYPFAPLHGPGEDPYARVELATDTQRNTSFRGVVKPTTSDYNPGEPGPGEGAK